MGKELNTLIGTLSLGYSASYICNLTFSPKEPELYNIDENGPELPFEPKTTNGSSQPILLKNST